MSRESAGIILFRRTRRLEVLIAHPGGPFWAGKDEGAWSIPKGELEPDEDPRAAAAREFCEEIGLAVDPAGLIDLGIIRQRSGKVVHGFALEGDVDPEDISANSVRLEWPRGSGREIVFPEIDRAAWVSPETAVRLLVPGQPELVDRLRAYCVDHRE
jgi:predicted NUDIX family NTP pyrophosphohydrolase